MHYQLAALDDEPRPAGAELRGARGGELLVEGLHAAKGGLDVCLQVALQLCVVPRRRCQHISIGHRWQLVSIEQRCSTQLPSCAHGLLLACTAASRTEAAPLPAANISPRAAARWQPQFALQFALLRQQDPIMEARRTNGLGAHRLPVELVVPRLRRVVERWLWAAVVPCGQHHLRSRTVLQLIQTF